MNRGTLGKLILSFAMMVGTVLAGPITAGTQEVAKVPRIGVLYSSAPTTSSHVAAALEQSLREHGTWTAGTSS